MLSTELINLHSNMSAPANHSAMSPVTPPAAPPAAVVSTLFAPAAFIEHKNLVLGTPGLATGSHVTTDSALTIWIHDQPFTSWGEAWKWIYQIGNEEARKGCAVDLVQQKIRSLDAAAKDAEEIWGLLKKDFGHIGLGKKESASLRANLDGYIKAVSYPHFSLPIRTVPSSA